MGVQKCKGPIYYQHSCTVYETFLKLGNGGHCLVLNGRKPTAYQCLIKGRNIYQLNLTLSPSGIIALFLQLAISVGDILMHQYMTSRTFLYLDVEVGKQYGYDGFFQFMQIFDNSCYNSFFTRNCF